MARKLFCAAPYRSHYMTNDFTSLDSKERGANAEPSAAMSPNSVVPASITEALERLDIETARRVQAEERLHETEERFRNLSERAGKFLWISDPQTNELIYVSPGYEEVWARTREDSYTSPEAWTNSF